MTKKQATTGVIDVKALLDQDGDYLRAMVRAIVEATLEAEMTAALGAEKGERTSGRVGYRSGYYTRALITDTPDFEHSFAPVEQRIDQNSTDMTSPT